MVQSLILYKHKIIIKRTTFQEIDGTIVVLKSQLLCGFSHHLGGDALPEKFGNCWFWQCLLLNKRNLVFIRKNHIEERYSEVAQQTLVLQLAITFIRYTSNIYKMKGKVIIIEATLDFSKRFQCFFFCNQFLNWLPCMWISRYISKLTWQTRDMTRFQDTLVTQYFQILASWRFRIIL